MILSKTWRYAVRALIYLNQRGGSAPTLSSIIAKDENIPAPFLVKILGMLANARIVDSTRGPRGGFVLAADPDKLTLMEIARATGYFSESDSCLLGYGLCSEHEPCAVHRYWEEPLRNISDFLEKTTLAELSLIDKSKDDI